MYKTKRSFLQWAKARNHHLSDEDIAYIEEDTESYDPEIQRTKGETPESVKASNEVPWINKVDTPADGNVVSHLKEFILRTAAGDYDSVTIQLPSGNYSMVSV